MSDLNIALLDKIATWLEGGAQHVDANGAPIQFDMSTGLTACGSSCCIAGAAVQFSEVWEDFRVLGEYDGDEDELPWDKTFDQAAETLGVTLDVADALFLPHSVEGGSLQDYTDPAWAARVIRGLIATGEVDWAAHKEHSA